MHTHIQCEGLTEESVLKHTELCSCRLGGLLLFPSGPRCCHGYCSDSRGEQYLHKWIEQSSQELCNFFPHFIPVTWTSCDLFADSPAGMQWKPTVTVVVFTGKQPGRQRSTGSTEKHLDSWPWMLTCLSSFTDSSFIRHSVRERFC